MSQGGGLDLSRYLELFFEEATEHLSTLERGLVQAERAPSDRGLIDDCFRAVHSLKGSGGSLGLHRIVDLAHVLETELDEVRVGAKLLTSTDASRLLAGVDLLARQIDAERDGTDVLIPGVQAWLDATPGAAPASEATRSGPVEPTPTVTSSELTCRPETFRCGNDPLPLLRDLDMMAGILSAELDVDAIPPLADLDPLVCHLRWKLQFADAMPTQALLGALAFADHLFDAAPVVPSARAATPAPPEAPAAASGAPAGVVPSPRHAERQTLRIATEKVDRLVDLVGELVIAQAILGELVEQVGGDLGERLTTAFAMLERNTREVQERAMGIRMMPIESALERLPRLVRELGSRLGKQLQLQVVGEDTELDRSVIEHLADPLTHLIRNCADHGVEPTDERLAKGKPAVGTIRIRALHEGSSVVIEVGDDGRGLDRERIRARAESRGLLAPGASLSDDEVAELVFAPGFSTAAEVSEVSGRGVGMDVVRQNIEALGGRVRMSSQPGHGTTVRMSFPLTLAIVEGLGVRVGSCTYIVPMASVKGSLRPNPGDVRAMLGRGEVVVIRETQLPLVRVSDALGVPGAVREPTEALCVLVEVEGDQVALMVDHITGAAQAVIKNIERNWTRVDGVMGATILGDGRVALVLDVPGVVRLALGRTRARRTLSPPAGGLSCTARP